jgi:hypothetical protein
MSPAVTSSQVGGEKQASTGPAYDYDVFISVHKKDERWVEEELRPPLARAELRVTGEWDFLGGEDIVQARQEAVERSRHTLVILTVAWCGDPLVGNDTFSAKYLDPIARDRRLLPLRLEVCTPPPGIDRLIGQLVGYDFTEATSRQAALAKLLADLGRSRETINDIVIQHAHKGIAALIQLMRSDLVRQTVLGIKETLTSVRDEIDTLDRCKKLHERFHNVHDQLALLRLTKAELEANTPAPGEADPPGLAVKWMMFEFIALNHLCPPAEVLVRFARDSFPAPQVLWVPFVEKSVSDLKEGSRNRKLSLASSALGRLCPVVEQQMSRFDQQLVNAAESLPLEKLVEKLQTVATALDELHFADTAAARVAEFKKVIPALQELHESLQALVINHNSLQVINDSLRSLDSPQVNAEDVELIWGPLAESMDALRPSSVEDWFLKFPLLRAELDGALAAVNGKPGDEAAAGSFRKSFSDFCSHAKTGFRRVDLNLEQLCGKVKKLGEALDAAIQEMQHD